MASDLNITAEQAQGRKTVTVFRLTGWLDQSSEDQLVDAAREAIGQGAKFLVLDLAGVPTLTSAGMRAIQRVHKLLAPTSVESAAKPLKLCNATPQVYQVLSMTGFLHNIPNYESTQTAVDSFDE